MLARYMPLSQSPETLPGVGNNLATKLQKCGIASLASLLFHLPYRYQDRTRITPIRDLRANEWCVIVGQVCKVQISFGKRRTLSCYVEDKTGMIKLKFFNFNQHQVTAFQAYPRIRAFGEVREFNLQFEMTHPEYQLINDDEPCPVEENLTPIYRTTQGLTQTRLRQLVSLVQRHHQPHIEALEWMSHEELNHYQFPHLFQALSLIHRPPPDTQLEQLETASHPAIKRIIFDELLAKRISMQLAKAYRCRLKAAALPLNDDLNAQFLNQLPFQLTDAQRRVSAEISQDLADHKPMFRLVQGDVGCGKTVIAALAALQAIANGYQVALMAPTDLLSEQHAINLINWLTPLGITCFRLSGKMGVKARREAMDALASGQCQLIIGTHALFQDGVEFSKLGLIIIDEQHRFGVEQRLKLQQKGQQQDLNPHQLMLTATPIPRTLAMSHFAHLDISVIDELPPGRTPIITAIISQNKREQVIERLKLSLAAGKQAYWVCTLIEESETLQCQTATDTENNLKAKLPGVRIGLVHGRLKPLEKDHIMAQFKAHELDLLVATTVIEVGVDVPNASLMIIDNAERLGLSQLHQLRGRVGRGTQESHCLLLYQSPLSLHSTERLKILRDTTDGFIIAEKDLQLRGYGDVLGKQQTGFNAFKMATLPRDAALLPLVAEKTTELLKTNPTLAKHIANRWLGDVDAFIHG